MEREVKEKVDFLIANLSIDGALICANEALYESLLGDPSEYRFTFWENVIEELKRLQL